MSWKEIHEVATLFDLHVHPSLKLSLLGKMLTRNNRAAKYFSPLSVRTDFPKLQEGNVDGLNSAIYVPEQELLHDCRLLRIIKLLFPFSGEAFSKPPFEVTQNIMNHIEMVVDRAVDPVSGKKIVKMALSLKELDEIISQRPDGPIAFIHSIEGAHSLGKPERAIQNLEELFRRGVASLTLAHFYDNGYAPPVFPFPEYVQKLGCFRSYRDLTKGLSDEGKIVVEKMVELGMIVDITHCTPQARKDVYDIVGRRAPILATHVGAYEINPNPYNLYDWEIKKISRSGGVVGVIFMNYWLTPYERVRGLDFIARTIEHFIQVAGENHVGIGSDFDGFTDPPDDMKDASALPFLTQRLMAEGYKQRRINKVLGENALSVLHDGWGKLE